MAPGLHKRWEHLTRVLEGYRRVLIAFSGGVDSVFLAAAALRILGSKNVLAVTSVSASLAQRELREVRDFSKLMGLPLREVLTQEFLNPNYTSNPSNRCFYCKTELFSILAPMAHGSGMVLVDGSNASDRKEYRPGRQAAGEWSVRHPLDEADLSKRDIRVLSRWLRLPTWKKPASPCLSSRIPYGTQVTPSILRRVEQAEDIVKSEGFRIVRVRHYGVEARIEVEHCEVPRLSEESRWVRIERLLREVGYQRVSYEPEGFQSGRLNG